MFLVMVFYHIDRNWTIFEREMRKQTYIIYIYIYKYTYNIYHIYMFKLASFPTWVTGSDFQLVSFPPAWPWKWTSILQKQTLYSANLITALCSWSSRSSFLQFRRQLISLARIPSLSPLSTSFFRTATIEIETCNFFRIMLFFSLYPFIFRFFIEISLCQECPSFCYSKKFSTWFFLSLSLSLHFCLSVSASAFVSLCLRGVYGSVHSC